MKILGTFLSVSLFFLLVLGVGFYFTREYLLYRGVENFKKSVLVVRKNNTGSSACAAKAPDLLGVNTSGADIITQLRFTSSSEYVAEVLCPGYSFDPIILDSKELDTYVTKVAGASGIVLGPERTGIELAVFEELQNRINSALNTNFQFIQKNSTVVMEDNQFVVLLPGEDLGTGPATSCEGYGFQCCQSDSQVGVGEPLLGTATCEKSCYSSCVRRPIVLSMNTNPFFDVQTRTLTVNSGESVDFGYVVDTGASETVQVVMNYGDGVTEDSIETSATLSHIYNCPTDFCEYQASLVASDSWGITSADTQVSRLQVRVRSAAF